MAICEKCGNHYLSKECLSCKYGVGIKKEKSNTTKIIVSMLFILVIALATIVYINSNTNPLIGKWQSTQNIPMFGKIIIEFTEDESISMGMVEKVKYKIKDDNVIVNSDTGMGKGVGIIYNIIDENTISSNFMNTKVVYKRK